MPYAWPRPEVAFAAPGAYHPLSAASQTSRSAIVFIHMFHPIIPSVRSGTIWLRGKWREVEVDNIRLPAATQHSHPRSSIEEVPAPLPITTHDAEPPAPPALPGRQPPPPC